MIEILQFIFGSGWNLFCAVALLLSFGIAVALALGHIR